MEFVKVTELKQQLDSLRPLNKDEVAKLKEIERIDEVYNSNALEGNTITRFETKMILSEGITISEKPMREHLEVINLNEAIDFVEELVSSEQPLSERLIKDIHRIVYDKLAMDKSNVGQYRRIPVEISGSSFVPPEPFHVPGLMQELVKWANTNQNVIHPVEYAALLHEKFVTIHPFIDGNGRTARLLMNFALTGNGYPPIIVKAEPSSRLRYNRTLEAAQVDRNLDPFTDFITELVSEKLEKMIAILKMGERLSDE
ncbi:Fic family protein [Vagococcus sp. BWB3-3]|uniref:Fic family protein n=1 Tax=Vagococcus allomyrinae TaxID=2794353 RepID=A0A940PAM3_9ENTE|nr:Fic family protein [Vagococcus allomyrinae]MBP1042676.1 Fic family protein [Vagococcus allomyrinae]